MALGMEVVLGPDHIVLDGDPAPLLKTGSRAAVFGPFLLLPNGWRHQDATWCRGSPQPKRLCARWRPSPLPKKVRAPHFRPTSLVAKRLH